MRKFLIIIILVFAIILFILASNSTSNGSIENLAYVIAMGIDTGNHDLMNLTLQIMIPNKSSASESSSQSNESTTTTVECTSINSGLNLINSYISKKLNLSHCKLIVISEEYAINDISDEITTLADMVEIRPNCSLVISKCKASDFLSQTKPVLETLTARFYDIILSSEDYTGFSKNVTISEFYTALQDSTTEPVASLAGINVLENHLIPKDTNFIDIDSSYIAGETYITNNSNMQISGLGIFQNGSLIGELNSMDSICHLILTNSLKNCLINIPDPFNSEEIISLSIYQYDKPKLNVQMINNSPYIDIKIPLKANIVSLSKVSDNSANNNLSVIAEYANSYITSHIYDYLYKISKEYRVDTVGFGKYALYKYLTLKQWENIEWNKNFENSFFHVETFTTIVNSNLVLRD